MIKHVYKNLHTGYETRTLYASCICEEPCGLLVFRGWMDQDQKEPYYMCQKEYEHCPQIVCLVCGSFEKEKCEFTCHNRTRESYELREFKKND